MRRLLCVIVILWCSYHAFGTTAYVTGCNGNNSGVSTQACTSANMNVTNGDILICAGAWIDPTATFTSFSKSSGTATVGTFTEINNVGTETTTVANGNNKGVQAWAQITGTGTLLPQITVSSAAASLLLILCNDISGASSSGPDTYKLVTQTNPGLGTDAVTTGSVTTTAGGDYLFGWVFDNNGNVTSYSAGTGYTLRDVNGTRSTESQIQGSSSSSTVATFTANTTGGGDTMHVGIIAIKSATLPPNGIAIGGKISIGGRVTVGP